MLVRRTAPPSVYDTMLFACLVGFVATQGFLIPVVALPGVNWAVWPSLPDLFGAALVVLTVAGGRQRGLSSFDRKLLWNLVLMELLFAANFLFVTIRVSSSGEGVRFGGFTLLLLAKYITVFWAAAHVALDARRIRVIHWAATTALLWLIGTMLADRMGMIELDAWTAHLPSSAGKWSTIDMNSTVGSSHGQTSVAILVIGAVVVMTARKSTGWFTEAWVLLIAGVGTFATGSRQGVVRILTFVGAYLVPQPKRLALVFAIMLPVAAALYFSMDKESLEVNDALQFALERQRVLLADPLSNEGLSRRPELWMSVFDTMNEKPIRWIVGYGIGNYAEFNNAAHNMILQLLQDGGFVFLITVTTLWVRIALQVWAIRIRARCAVALFAALLSSSMTSGIFYPNLATGWYLGLFFIALHIEAGALVRQPTTPRLDVPAGHQRTHAHRRATVRSTPLAVLESNE